MTKGEIFLKANKQFQLKREFYATCPTYNLPDMSIALQFIKLNSIICLTYHLSINLKIRHKSFPTTHELKASVVSVRHSLCPYGPLKLCTLFELILLSFFRKDFIYRGFCWICMGNPLKRSNKSIFIAFAKTQLYSNWNYLTCKCLAKMLFCMFKFCLISNYSNSVLLMSVFVILDEQGKLTIKIIEINKKIQHTIKYY